MTPEAKIETPADAPPRSLGADVQTLGALAAGDDLAALEAFCRVFEASHPHNHLALLHRCRAKERLSGVAAAAADVAVNWSRFPPTPGLILFVVSLMLRARHFDAARGVVAAVRGTPGLGGLLPLLSWRIAVESSDGEAIAAMLAAEAGTRGNPLLEAWKAAGLLLIGRPQAAMAQMRDAIGRAEQPAALLPAIRRATGDMRLAFADMLQGRLDAEPGLPGADNLLHFIAASHALAGDHAEALRLLCLLLATESPLEDRARMLAAQSAAALGDAAAAREHLSVLIIRHCPPHLAREMMATLGAALFDVRGQKGIMRLLARLPRLRPEARSAAGSLDLLEDRFDAIIDGFFALDPSGRQEPGILFPFCSSCIETGRWDDLRRGIRSLPLDGSLSAAQLRRLKSMLSCLDDADLVRPVSAALLAKVAPDGAEALMLALQSAEGTALEDAAGRALRHLGTGSPALMLRLALSRADTLLSGRLRPDLVAALRQQGIDGIPLSDIAQADLAWSQRHLCGLIQAGFPEARPEAVSIIAPVHRADDLPNLRASIARQRWTNREVIVVANGPLCNAPLVAEVLAGLPDVTVLHASAGTVGACLNLAVARAAGDIVMRFDADDVYFADYVSTAVRALQATGAEVAGKHSCFVWLEGLRGVFLRNPAPFYNDTERAGHYGVGGTHVIRRDVFREVRYSEAVTRGEDYRFFEHCALRGLRNVNLDPFNYLIVRREDRAAHTWQVDDLTALGSGICYIGGPEVVPLIAAPDRAAERILLPGM